jgi:hypothetical protein
MGSDLKRITGRVTPEFRAWFEAKLSEYNAKTGSGLSESQFVSTSVKFFIDYHEDHGVWFKPKAAMYSQTNDTTAAMVADETAGAKMAAPEPKFSAPAHAAELHKAGARIVAKKKAATRHHQAPASH